MNSSKGIKIGILSNEILRCVLNRYNLVPLFLVPAVLWGIDLLIHLVLGALATPIIWMAVLTLVLPVVGYLLTVELYRRLSGRLGEMLPPEVSGLIGFLYGQPTYMVASKLILEGVNSISFFEAIKTIVTLTPFVPLSTITISSYGGSLFAVPLTCLAMIMAALRCRRNLKQKGRSTPSMGRKVSPINRHRVKGQ